MTNEELVQKIKEGQTELINDLWAQIERFVQLRAHKFFRNTRNRCQAMGLEVDDLYQIGYLSLNSAIEKYDSCAGSTFIYYYTYYLNKAFSNAIKLRKQGKKIYDSSDVLARTVSLESVIYENKDNNKITLESRMADESAEQALCQIESIDYNTRLHNDLETAIATLCARDEQIIRDYYYNNLSYESISLKLNVSSTTIHNCRLRALTKLRRHPALKPYRDAYIDCIDPYRAGMNSYKNKHSTSLPEYIVLQLEKYEAIFND